MSASPSETVPANGRRRTRSGLVGGLAVGILATLLGVLVLEAAIRVVMPQDLDFYNSDKIKKASTKPGRSAEFIPGSRNDSYIGVPVAINAQGLRDHEIAVPKPPDTLRIVVVGDSVAFGYGVRLEETFAKVLESKLNSAGTPGVRYEVLDAGLEGTNLTYYYHFLRDEAPALEPDLVVIALVLNDIRPYTNLDTVPTKVEARSSRAGEIVRAVNGELLLHSQLYLASYMATKSLLYRLGVLDLNRIHGFEFLWLRPPSADQDEAWRTSMEMLVRLAALTRQRGWPVVLTVFPEEMQLGPSMAEIYRTRFHLVMGDAPLAGEPQRRLRAFGARVDVPVLDLLPAFRASDQVLFLRNRAISFDPVHPSPAGHRLAGEELYRALANGSLAHLARGVGARAATTPAAATIPSLVATGIAHGRRN